MTAETLEKANNIQFEIKSITTRLKELDGVYNGVIKNKDYGMDETEIDFHVRTTFGGCSTISTRNVKITTTNVLNFVAIEIKAMTERKAALEKEFDEL